MKAKLKNAHAGLPPGAEVDVLKENGESVAVQWKEVVFMIHRDELEFQKPATPAAPVERYSTGPWLESLARQAYDTYTEKVGGVAWNGDKLPPASEFFEDPAKQLQANAWRYALESVLTEVFDTGNTDIAPGHPELPLDGGSEPEIYLDNPEIGTDILEEANPAEDEHERGDGTDTQPPSDPTEGENPPADTP